MPAFAADRALPPQAPQNWAYDLTSRIRKCYRSRSPRELSMKPCLNILAMLWMTLPQHLSPDAKCAPFAAAAAAAPPEWHHSLVSGME